MKFQKGKESNVKIVLTVGHSVLKNGCTTSANGIINEYQYNKELVPMVAKYLKQLGHTVDIIICPEKKFIQKGEESTYKLKLVNNGKYDLAVELHLNATGTSEPNGCEVLYISDGGRVFAERVQAKLSKVFEDRGIKLRKNLYMLNQTKPVTIMLESFFCTNESDCKIGADKDKIARLIAEGITGKNIPEEVKEIDKIYRVQVGAYADQKNAIAVRTRLKLLGYDATIV